MITLKEFKKYKKIHMVGIGGVSMSGIAEIIKSFGIKVTGSNIEKSSTTEKLTANGILVTIGHSKDNIPAKCDLVVYTAAVKLNNIELVTAKKLGIPIIERADFLGLLTSLYKDTICISGTHGKTTTTSMISVCFVEAKLDPTIQVGANLKQLDGNYRAGNSNYLIIEACEYVESFLKFFPKTEIILNVDNDHLDYFKNFDNIKKAFVKYAKLLPDDGLLVINGDDPSCIDLSKKIKCNFLTYGMLTDNCDYVAKNLTMDDNGFYEFDVYFNNVYFQHFKLSVPGIHNILNALACIATCNYYDIPVKSIKKSLRSFTGANRRFEYIGTFNDISVFDDYGHHPTEIRATYDALLNKKFRKSWVIFQPHTYSRTKHHLDEFATSLLGFDNIIITDIYASREKDNQNISSKDLVKKIKSFGAKNVIHISNFEEIAKHIKSNAKPGDIVLTLGAGNVVEIGPELIK